MAFITLNPPTPIPGNALSSIVLFNHPAAHGELIGEPFVTEDDPFNQDLNWQGLIIQPGTAPKLGPDDHVLLWKEHTPIIYVRYLSGNQRQLVFNFDFSTSNVTRLPAFVLLVSRFVESVRTDKQALETRNVELSEPLTMAAVPQAGPIILHDTDGSEIKTQAGTQVTVLAPSLPGFFSVTQGGKPLLLGAAQFADARESDFRTAATLDTLAGHHVKLVESHTRADAATPLWLILIGILLILNWVASRPRVA